MVAVASTNPPFNPVVKIALAGLLGASVLLLASGCGHQDAAADFHAPPPQSLSEPVKPVERIPAPPPMVPVSVDNEYAGQKPGETRALPAFDAPPPAPIPAAVVTAPPAAPVVIVASEKRDAKGRYHVMQKGETLFAVARMYNVKPKAIISANQFSDPNRVCVGTKVYIPD